MSQYENVHDDIPRFEPWLGVMVTSLIPAVVGLYVHARHLVPLIVATAALFLASLVMLRRQTIRRRRERPATLPDARAVARSTHLETEAS